MGVSAGGERETVFTYASPALKFGPGASEELSFDLRQLGAGRVLLVTDAGLVAAGHPARIAHRLQADGLDVTTYDEVHVEPTDDSMREAVAFAREHGPFEVILAVGGGSSIDTAKAVNLLTTNDGELEDYLNAPIGRGRTPERPLLPLVAVPTTTGTGAESTTICVLDVLSLQVKTGISHPRLRPTLAVVDPALTLSQPAEVTAASGLDIVCHALESYTAREYTSMPAKTAGQRVPYCGANPISDIWAEAALTQVALYFRRAVADGADREAREGMALAATYAGLGFGNAGVHLPHANAYPVAGRVRDFRPAGYPAAEPLVPHGMSVALTAPASFRRTFDASPERHLRAARLLDPATAGEGPEVLADVLTTLLHEVGMPSGLAAVGYADADVPDLVEGALRQQRLLANAPIDVTPHLLTEIFAASLENW